MHTLTLMVQSINVTVLKLSPILDILLSSGTCFRNFTRLRRKERKNLFCQMIAGNASNGDGALTSKRYSFHGCQSIRATKHSEGNKPRSHAYHGTTKIMEQQQQLRQRNWVSTHMHVIRNLTHRLIFVRHWEPVSMHGVALPRTLLTQRTG